MDIFKKWLSSCHSSIKARFVQYTTDCCPMDRVSSVDWGRGCQLESMASGREMLIEILNYSGFSGVVFPRLRAVGSWEEVFLLSMDLTVSQNVFDLELQDPNFCLKKLALAFLTACVYWFLTSMKRCISRGLFDDIAVRHRLFLCWSRAVRSGVNQELYLVLLLHFFNGACLFKMVRKALLKNNHASCADGMRSISFQVVRTLGATPVLDWSVHWML